MTSTPPPSDGVPTFRFSTEDFPERERLSALREIFGRTVVKLDFEPLTATRLRCEATICRLPGLGVLFGSCSALQLIHPRELADDDDLSVMIGPWKKWGASMMGRAPVLGSNDGVMMWNAEVGSMTVPSCARFVTFRVPASAIAPLVPDIGKVVAQRIPADSEALALLRRYLGIIQDEQAPAMPELQHLVATHVYDLLAVALGATRDATEIANGRGVRVARLRAIKTDILANLGRVDLSVDEVAARQRVTPRYVQWLFETEGITFTQFVRDRRLAHAYRMLTDPLLADRSVTSVAFDTGFGDLSYFNRTFRRRFGDTPSGTRMQARRDDR